MQSVGVRHGWVRAHVQSAVVGHGWERMCRGLERVMGGSACALVSGMGGLECMCRALVRVMGESACAERWFGAWVEAHVQSAGATAATFADVAAVPVFAAVAVGAAAAVAVAATVISRLLIHANAKCMSYRRMAQGCDSYTRSQCT